MRARIVTLLAALAGAGALVIGPGAPVSAAACPNEALRTGLSAALPDCRAWELVSPAVKAHSVTANTGRFRVSEGGSSSLPTAAVFQSLGGFSDPEGSGVAIDYMAQRTLAPNTQGWETHPLTPPQDSLSFAAILNAYEPYYVGEGTPDLTKMLFRTSTELSPAPNVRTLPKVYLRPDLRAPDRGTYELLNDPGFQVPPFMPPAAEAMTHVAGASTDLSRVLLESRLKLTPDAPASMALPKVYKSVDGVLQLVGILPADEGGGPASGAIAGQSAGSLNGPARTPNVISDDGTRAFFTVPAEDFRGRLYMRDDQRTPDVGDDVTVRIDKPEREPALPGPQPPATYWDAAADGSRVFFTTSAALTDDAPTTNLQHLYVYDTTSPASDPHNLTYISKDEEPADGLNEVDGVTGASADGRTVYFIQRGQIVSGQPVLDGDLGIYGWREGVGVKFIGRLQDTTDSTALEPKRGHGLDDQWGAVTTPDGSHLLVSLHQPPWPGTYDQGECDEAGFPVDGKIGCRQLYLYDFETGDEPVCVSCRPSGAPSTRPAYFFARVGAGGSIPDAHQSRPLSNDGRYVYFTTAEGLLPTDLNGVADVYRYDASTGAIELITAGDRPDGAYFLEASADGRDVFVATRVQLNPWDTDHQMDVYDARVNGGVPPPPLPLPECSGESCRAPASAPPSPAAIGTSVFATTSRPGRKKGISRRCGKRQRKVRRNGVSRCVRQAKGKKRHHRHRRGGAKRRTTR